MDGLQKLTNALSNGTIPDPLRPPLPQNWGFATQLPLLSQERVKLRTSNLVGTFTRPIQVKACSKFRRRWSVGVSRDCPNFLGTPYYLKERVKLRTSNFVGTFIQSIRTKAHENVGNSGRGHSQAVPKIFRAPICRAHCAVIFAIAQLSCFTCSVRNRFNQTCIQ